MSAFNSALRLMQFRTLAGAVGFEPTVAHSKGVDQRSQKVAVVRSLFGFRSIVRRRTLKFMEVHPGCRQGCRQAPCGVCLTDIISTPLGTAPKAGAMGESAS